LVAYLRMRGFKFTHIANETGSGRMAKLQGIRNKQQGLSKGFPDYLIVIGSKLIAVELKRTSGGKLSLEQAEWLKCLAGSGVDAFVAKGAQEAIEYLEIAYPRKLMKI